ncbi:hypothetical protein Chor_000287, partial [Crotalus horridus]
ADLQEMYHSSKDDEMVQAGLRGALPLPVVPHDSQNSQHRVVLGELHENGQCLRSSSHKSFTVYIDEVEERSKNNFIVAEEVEHSMCETETSTIKSSLHLLLNLSTVSPMLVDKSLQNEDCEDNEVDMSIDEYAEDIHNYLRDAEVSTKINKLAIALHNIVLPRPCYMRKQPDITSGMRAILVDWLAEVGEEYKLQTETLYLAVNYLDRFLSCMSVLRGKLQLVGTAAILLAAKYEEIYPPEVEEFVYITDDTYSKKQLLRMEHLLLKVLAFDLTVPTVNQFLLQYLQRHGVNLKTENFARYIAELSLLEADPFLKYLPSQMAAAAYCLANYTVNRHFWVYVYFNLKGVLSCLSEFICSTEAVTLSSHEQPETLAAFTGYSLSEIVPCLSDLHKACLDAPHRQQQAIREKYKLTK